MTLPAPPEAPGDGHLTNLLGTLIRNQHFKKIQLQWPQMGNSLASKSPGQNLMSQHRVDDKSILGTNYP